MRWILLVALVLVACVTLTAERNERALFTVENHNFYPVTLTVICDGAPIGPRFVQVETKRTHLVDVRRCLRIGWEARLFASNAIWRVDHLQVNPGDVVDITVEATLQRSFFMIR